MKEFITFIKKQGVVGLAIGFVLGGSVSKVVSALVEDLINPVLGLVLGAVGGLQNAVLRLGPITLKYGHFLSVIIDFVVVALVVYFVFQKLETKLDEKK